MTAIKIADGIEEGSSSDDYDQVMFIQNVETIEAFSSHVVLVKAEKAYIGGHIDVMTQALQTEDGSLPQGLTIQNTYTELRQGSKKVVVVVRNSMAYPQNPQMKAPVAREVVTLLVPRPPMEAQLQEGADKPQDPHTPKLIVRQRYGKLFDELDLSGLDSCPPELADAACQLLAKYHDMFFIGPHTIGLYPLYQTHEKVTDDTPFKE